MEAISQEGHIYIYIYIYIYMLERLQRRATNIIPKLRDIGYEMRLKECGITTQETRRLRGDNKYIEVFKMLKILIEILFFVEGR